MNDGSLMTSLDWLAEWGHDPSCSLRTCPGCCLLTTGVLFPELFTDWPTSATTSLGGLSQQSPLEHPIDASDGGDLPTLPTPRAQNGEDRNNKIYPRPLDQPQNLENALARLPTDSDPTPQQSTDGNASSDDQLLTPPTMDD